MSGWMNFSRNWLTVVYDACQSGSFIPILAVAGEQERLIISSSGAEQRAHFASKGDVSFSFHFWTNFIGGDIYRSFTASKNAITTIFNRKQTAEIEADGNGLPNTKNDTSRQTFRLVRASRPLQMCPLSKQFPIRSF